MTKSAGLRHDALLYASGREFVATLEPFVRDGLDAGEAVIAVTTEANIALLRETLDARAGDVAFAEATEWYRRPAQTIAGYRRVLDDRLTAGAPGVRVIGEVQFGATAEEQIDWVRYEAALNRAFADRPAWVVCPYDERVLPAPVLRHAADTHPHVIRGGQRRPSTAYVDPGDLIGRLTGASEHAGPPLAEFLVDGSVAAARKAVRDTARRAGLDDDTAEHLTAAVNEVLTNAIVHGRAPVELRLYANGATLHCEVADAGGLLTDRAAGYTPPATAEPPEGGMGLWLARQLCDRVEVLPIDGKTVVRLTVAGPSRAATASLPGRK